MDFEYYFGKYIELLSLQEFDERDIDYTGLERHISFLKQVAIVENSSMMVVDIYKKQYVFMQSRYLKELGYELSEVMKQGPRLIYSKMHPDDVPAAIETHYKTTEFLMGLPDNEKKEYKCIYEFRLLNKEGRYLRFIQQLIPLELDKKGNIWLMLLVNDLLPGKDDGSGFKRKLIHIPTGKICLFGDEDSAGKQLLSRREIEILGLLAQGKASKQVADTLFISVNTVNNHRKNILEKTNAENTAEAISYAHSIGLI